MSTKHLTNLSQAKKVEQAFLAHTAKMIADVAWHDINWDLILGMFAFSDILEKVPRLVRSQQWGDPDYPENVHKVFRLAYEEDPRRAISMAIYIIQNEIKPSTDTLEKYPIVKAYLENKEGADFSQIFPKVGVYTPKYLDITEVPDDFYKDLIDLINKCYAYGIYPAVLIFSRKLIENLLVDILRRKYGMRNVDLFFDVKHGRFHGFNILLKNFESRIDEFKPIIPSLDRDFINKINEFRESGNSAAHALEIYVKKDEIDNSKDKLEFLVKTLIRLYKNIVGD